MKVKKVEFRLGELFCGPGGLACGARMAGCVRKNGVEYSIRHAWATDYDESTCRTYSHNICRVDQPGTVVHADIRKLDLNVLKKISDIDALPFGFLYNDYFCMAG